MDPAEKALRQALQKAAAPKPQPPVHRISHSPQISSVPGYPSRQDPRLEDVRSDEVAQTSPAQTSSAQRQRTHESMDHPEPSEHHQGRDAQLDHHISISRKLSQPRWQCQNCRLYNGSYGRACINCGNPRPTTTSEVQTENVKGWKHVTRAGSNASLEHSQPETILAQGRPGGAQTLTSNVEETAKAKVIEQKQMERMERTKGGDFVGLRSEHETATSRAMKASYWSSETSESQVPQVESTMSSTPDKSKSTVDLEDSQTHSAENLQVKEMQGFREERSVQKTSDANFEDRPVTGDLKRWRPMSARLQPPLEKSFQRDPADQSGVSTHPSSIKFEHGQNVKVSRTGRDSPMRPEPQEPIIAKPVFDRPAPYSRDSDRKRMRKSRVATMDDDMMNDEDLDLAARRIERKEQRKKAKAMKKAMAPPTPIYLPEYISISNLAGVLKVRVEDFIHKMRDLGFEESNNDFILDAETAGLIAVEFGFEPIFEQAEDPDLLPRPLAEDKSVLPPRPPVVTIMGHVDHGKTTLLDYLRKSSVAASEHGGITQHIGAFSVPMPGGRLFTFLDTPGHEAFLSMRQRGANVTDIVILVVAADDSVKPQTVEAIRHAQTANVPMIIAINKIDKEDSNPERVKQDLARYGVEVEDYGGDTQTVCVSGKTGQGMEELEDAAVALADILDMRSEIDGQAEGWVLEATTRKAGRVATVLVRRGTLRPSDIIVAGTSWARVRSLRNEAGVMLKSAGPGTPVEIDGWREQPTAGDEVIQAPDEQKAKAVVSYRLEAHERTQMATDMAAVNEARRLEQEKREEPERAAELAQETSEADAAAAAAAIATEGESASSTPSFQQVFFIVKADVSGSVEAVTNAVSGLGNSEIRPHILRTGVGPVTEFDIDHAAVAKGYIISFNTTVDGNIQRMAEAKGVTIVNQSIIYRLVDDVKAKLSDKLPELVTQKVLGEAEIAQVFEVNPKGRVKVRIAGCRVKNGVIGRNNKVRVLREKEVIYDGIMTFHDARALHSVYADFDP